MMKKHLLYLFFFALALGSCKKDDTDPIIGNVDERLSGTLAEYQAQLVGAEFGWKAYLLTDNETPATFLFNFSDKNRITMAADYKPTPSESSYRLKALQRPTLLFDSYSTLHLIADPTSSVFGGETASGYYSDFEFAFLSASADTIKLEGTFNQSKLLLIRSKSATESADIFSSVESISNTVSKLRTYFKRTTVGGIECEVKLDGSSQIISFSYLDGTTLKTVKSSYYVSGTIVNLYTPLVVGTATITKLDGLIFDSASGFLNANANGAPIQIKEAIVPLSYDATAAARFNGTTDKQWSSYYGFTRDGVQDYLKLRTIPNFNRLVHWIRYNAAYDLVGFTFGNSINYGPAITATVTSNGLIKYTLLGYLGTVPPAYASMVVNTATNFAEAQGFYVIQTGSSTYDLVSVKDARTWIGYQ